MGIIFFALKWRVNSNGEQDKILLENFFPAYSRPNQQVICYFIDLHVQILNIKRRKLETCLEKTNSKNMQLSTRALPAR